MKINGREIKFLRTVKSTCDIAEMCPDKDLERASELFIGDAAKIQINSAKLIHILNEGYEMNKHFENQDYEPNVISVDEVLYLQEETFSKLLDEAIKSFTAGGEVTVETEEPKKAKKKTK